MIPREDTPITLSPPAIVSPPLHVSVETKEDVPGPWPFSPRMSSRRSRWNGNGSSRSSFSSLSAIKLKVTFNEQVRVQKYTPDWADPRVQAYEQAKAEGKCPEAEDAEVEHDDLRRLDLCYLNVMRKHPSSSFFDIDTWSPRGLEPLYDWEIAFERRKARLQTVLIVLLAQARKAEHEDIAKHYSKFAQKNLNLAHRQGQLDELDAQHHLGEQVLSSLMFNRRRKSGIAFPDRMEQSPHSTQQDRSNHSKIAYERPERTSRRFSQLLEDGC